MFDNILECIKLIVVYLDTIVENHEFVALIIAGVVSGLVAILTILLTMVVNSKNIRNANKQYENELSYRKFEKLINDWNNLAYINFIINEIDADSLDDENKKLVYTSISTTTLKRNDICKDINTLKNIAQKLRDKEFSIKIDDFRTEMLKDKHGLYDIINIGVYEENTNTIYLSDLKYIKNFTILNAKNLKISEHKNYIKIAFKDFLNNADIISKIDYDKTKVNDVKTKLNADFEKFVIVEENIEVFIKSIECFNALVSDFLYDFYNERSYEKYIKYYDLIQLSNSFTKIYNNFHYFLPNVKDKNSKIDKATKYVVFSHSTSVNEFSEADALIFVDKEKVKQIIDLKLELEKQYDNCFNSEKEEKESMKICDKIKSAFNKIKE